MKFLSNCTQYKKIKRLGLPMRQLSTKYSNEVNVSNNACFQVLTRPLRFWGPNNSVWKCLRLFLYSHPVNRDKQIQFNSLYNNLFLVWMYLKKLLFIEDILHSNMTSFKRFEYTPVVKYEYIGWAVLIVLPRHMIVYGWSTRRHRMIT